jgi:hypothetical protein
MKSVERVCGRATREEVVMYLAPPRRPRRNRVGLTIAVALAALTLGLSLPACQLVEDSLTGVPLSDATGSANACFDACRVARQNAQAAETARHSSAVVACAGDTTCIALENARYQSAQQQIVATFMACKDGCHHQGGGDAN